MPLISVIIPTIPGREETYQRIEDSYCRHTPEPHEIITEYGHPTVGCAWQAGADKARGDFIHLANDDCQPWPDWWHPAVEACQRGFVPSPMVYAPDGYPQALPQWGVVAEDWTPVHCAMIPFMSRAQWEMIRPLLTSHYHSDNFFTERAQMAGWPCRLRTGYAFTHHWAMPGRGAGMSEGDRMVYDQGLYHRAMAMVEAGQWVEPWPPGGRA